MIMNKRLRNYAFSLMEMVVVLALIGLLAGLVAVNYDAIISSFTQPSLEKTLFRAIRQARYQASLTKDYTFLRFSDEKYEFVIENSQKKVLATLGTTFDIDNDTVTATFIALNPTLEDHNHWHWETTDVELNKVMFTPYSVSSPFQVKLISPNDDTTITLDPFSSFPMQDSFAPTEK